MSFFKIFSSIQYENFDLLSFKRIDNAFYESIVHKKNFIPAKADKVSNRYYFRFRNFIVIRF